MKFSYAAQESAAYGVKTLVYGPAGVGKTVLMATLPSPVLISAESGALSLRESNLRKLFGNTPTICYNMPLITVANVDDLRDAYAWCVYSAEARQFGSIGLDSISEIAEVILNNAKLKVKDPRQAYGELIEKTETLIRAFRDINGKHVCLSAKMELSKDELTGITKYMPSMPGAKLSQKLAYFFDEVFHFGIGKTPQNQEYRYLRTQPDIQFEAKDRSGALAPIEYPHMGNIFGKILQG